MPTMAHFVDNLLDRIDAAGGPVCVGFDPVYDRIPSMICDACPDELTAIHTFAAQVLPVLAKHVPAVKPQSACFERYGFAGSGVYDMFCASARQLGLVVIGDQKRGDIGISAEHYAVASLVDPPASEADEDQPTGSADAVTVNSYFGRDGLVPFCDVAAEQGKGVFALVRTSNPGGDAIQSLTLDDGRSVAEAVGGLVAEVGSEAKYVGERGYSLLGAVVGATKPGAAAKLRETMPQQMFLVPGFGAQGGSAADVRACFKPDGTGAIITASRSILYAYERTDTADWVGAIEAAAVEFKQQVAAILG